jgi:adenylate cyclase
MAGGAFMRSRRWRLRGYLLSVAGWTAALPLFVLIRFVGLKGLPQFAGFDPGQIKHRLLFLGAVSFGPVLGTVFYLLQVAFDQPAVRRRPYGTIILMQTAGCVALVVLAQAGAAVVEQALGYQPSLWSAVRGRIFSTNFLVMLIYLTVVSALFLFLRQVDHKFGPGNLWKLVIGRYHHPREEERIFMFLDLKGSTSLAERLGHVQFSRLIQDCFADLSVVGLYRAQVYQYVGDEAILLWDVDAGLREANCIRAYFRFRDRLRERAAHYQREYGEVPVFKAGVNIGCATVVEVGEIKREISYLGDVLNTAARIQGKCSELGEDLLISEALHRRLERLPGDLEVGRMGEVALRGREQAVSILSVRRVGSNPCSNERGRMAGPEDRTSPT